MAKIDKNEMKIYLSINADTEDYDVFISDMIDFAYGKVSKFTKYDPSNDKFTEYGDVNDDIVKIRTVATDAALSALKIDGVSLNIASDVKRKDYYRWEVTNETYIGGEEFEIVYTSAYLTATLKKIIREIIIFEVQKLPHWHDSISRKSASVGEMSTESFVDDRVFYERIENEISNLFFRGI